MNALANKFSRITTTHWIAWGIVGLLLAGVLLGVFLQILRPDLLTQSLLTGLGGMLLGSLALLAVLVRQREAAHSRQAELQAQLAEAEQQVTEAYQRLEAIFQISSKFVEAMDEKEIIELVLRQSVDLVGATGASYVPLDERGQPLTAINHGELPFPVFNDWVEYLASPAVRDRCRTCKDHGKLKMGGTCPLLQGPFSDAIGMFCLPLRRGDREFGVLNLFLPNTARMDGHLVGFLQTLIDHTALALDGVYLRRREAAALQQLQAVRERTDLNSLLNSLLQDIHRSLEADFSLLGVREADNNLIQVTLGYFPPQARPFVDGVVQSVMTSQEPVLIGDVAGDHGAGPGIRSLMAVPLLTPDRSILGVLVTANRRSESFLPRQLSMLQTVAGQVVLAIQNANQMAELEFRVILDERTRLAREIHDGLAQTLGFLKLQTAQMQNYLAKNEIERLRQSASLCYTTLSEAYQDVRQAIDGLRIWPDEEGMSGWLKETVAEFEEISGIPVHLDLPAAEIRMPPEVHAQLIRIAQEALSNVRKHAQASQVWITCQEKDGELWMEIRDDGIGFSPQDVPGASRYGLRGMRERAELVGADFQVISRPDEGTTVLVRLPLYSLQRLSFHLQ